MDNQHRRIKGYRDFSEDELAQINAVKDMAEKVKILVDTVDDVADRDGRWLAIARTDLQKGFMALVRAIARPDSF